MDSPLRECIMRQTINYSTTIDWQNTICMLIWFLSYCMNVVKSLVVIASVVYFKDHTADEAQS